MSIEVPISPDVEAVLRKHSTDTGLPIETIAARLLDRSVRKILDLVEISGPSHRAFEESGMTEDQLSDLLESEKHAMRAERRANNRP